jgi:hypothetical protein
MSENRKLKRRSLIRFLKVFDRKNRRMVGHLGDITQEGILVLSQTPIKAAAGQDAVSFGIMVPGAGSGEDVEIEVDAARVWSKRDQSNGLYAAGFKIERISPDDVRLISATVDRYGAGE